MIFLLSALACSPPDDTSEGADALALGILAPETGGLQFLAPGLLAAVELAADEVVADGSLGRPLTTAVADSSDEPDLAIAGATELLEGGADVVVGALASGMSLTVIDQITGAGVMQISPANTAAAFTDHPDGGLYFRTAPSDAMQGAVLGNLVVADGHTNVVVLALDDDYAALLASAVEAAVTAGGGRVTTLSHPYEADSYADVAAEAAAAAPDAVVILGFGETVPLVGDLVAAGVGPQDVATFFCDGNLGDYAETFEPGLLAGVRATMPGAPMDEAFMARLLGVDPALEDGIYAAEAYDAVILTALASIAAESDDGAAVAAEMVAVSRDGQPCDTFSACAAALSDGVDIDYQGMSGPITFTAAGDPGEAWFGVYTYDADNLPSGVEYVVGAW